MKLMQPTATPIKRWCIAAIASVALTAAPVVAQQGEDEWYDPTDWFDGNNVEVDDTYDYDLYDYGFDDTYDYGTAWDEYDTWGEDDWTSDYYDAGYWDEYDWYADTDTIEEPYDDDTFDYAVYGDNPGSQQNRSGQRSQSKQQNRMQGGDGSKQVATLSGTIQGLRQMRLERGSGATGTYTLAKVKLNNGQSTVVNLGRQSQLNDINLKKGDQIQALGRRGTVAGETVFVAHKLRTGNQTIDANPVIRLASQNRGQNQQRQKAQQQRSQQAQSQQQNRNQSDGQGQAHATFAGTVSKISKPDQGSGESGHTLVQLKLNNGQTRVVDFGPAASVEKIKLNEGDRITVKGQTRQLNGQQVLMPRLLKIEGERVNTQAAE